MGVRAFDRTRGAQDTYLASLATPPTLRDAAPSWAPTGRGKHRPLIAACAPQRARGHKLLQSGAHRRCVADPPPFSISPPRARRRRGRRRRAAGELSQASRSSACVAAYSARVIWLLGLRASPSSPHLSRLRCWCSLCRWGPQSSRPARFRGFHRRVASPRESALSGARRARARSRLHSKALNGGGNSRARRAARAPSTSPRAHLPRGLRCFGAESEKRGVGGRAAQASPCGASRLKFQSTSLKARRRIARARRAR